MDREAWRAVVHGVTKSQTQLSDWTTRSSMYFKVQKGNKNRRRRGAPSQEIIGIFRAVIRTTHHSSLLSGRHSALYTLAFIFTTNLNTWYYCCCCLGAQSCLTLLWPHGLEFSRQEYWTRLPFPFSGGSSWPAGQTCISCLCLLHWQAGSLLPSHWGNHWVLLPHSKLSGLSSERLNERVSSQLKSDWLWSIGSWH